MANKFKNKRTISFRPKKDSARQKRKLDKMKLMQNKLGIKMKKFKKDSEVVKSGKEAENEETVAMKASLDVKEKNQDLKDTRGSSSKEQSKDAIIEQEDEDGSQIDRCSNPMSVHLEEIADFEFDGSITEEDEEDSDNSFGF